MRFRPSGIYPMLFAFFGPDGGVDRRAMARQVEAAVAAGAGGVAVLGLATEVGKLSRAEQRQIVSWVAQDLGGRLPLAVTVADGNVADMVDAARFAVGEGASWLILQPPRPPASGADLIAFFAAVAASVDVPVAIQNAPEFLGIGLTPAELLELNRRQPNVCIVKAESSAVAVGRMVEVVGREMTVFNGRAGLELTDNYRAGCQGMIPGIEAIDLQVGIARAMVEGREAEAEALYRRLLPSITFTMQGVAHLVLYAKIIAAIRLGLPESALRLPSETPTALGREWAARLAAELGPLA